MVPTNRFQLGVPKENRTVSATIYHGNVIAGFAKGPVDVDIQNRIDALFAIVNTSSHKKFIAARKLINNAKDVATGVLPGTDHTDKVYGWRTEAKGAPSSNSRLVESLQGQSFYTLKEDYLKSLKKNE